MTLSMPGKALSLPVELCRLLFKAEEAHSNHKADDAISQQAQYIGQHLRKIFAQNHNAVQALHCPRGKA